jgi:hypothetical protein
MACFAVMIANFGVKALVQMSKCTDYLRHDSWTTGDV